MKANILASAIALPVIFALASCDAKKSEEVSTGADKVAEGVEEMTAAAVEATEKAADDAAKRTEEIKDAAIEEIEEAAEEAVEEIKDSE